MQFSAPQRTRWYNSVSPAPSNLPANPGNELQIAGFVSVERSGLDREKIWLY
jgi:hypothetical protein